MTYELFLQRHLLKLHAVHASIGSTEQRSCDNDAVLHICCQQTVQGDKGQEKAAMKSSKGWLIRGE